MIFPSRYSFLFFIAITALSVVTGFLAFKVFQPPPIAQTKPKTPHFPTLSALADPPNWPALEAYQQTITRGEFERLLSTVFTTGDAWRNFIEIGELEARIKTDDSAQGEIFHLRFAVEGGGESATRHWRIASELPPTTPEKPLAGLNIAIDPGHIGGEWAKMEERWFVVGTGAPVCEGDMTLLVAQLLKPKLEALGATVSLVREKNEPVTIIRPASLESLAKDSSPPDASPARIRRSAELLFYRTAEIRARAELVNHTLKPDLVLCLHFNAEPWGAPNEPTLVDRTHNHLILNGGYTDDEVALADQRFALLEKLLQHTHREEVLVGTTVAEAFTKITSLPPYIYPPEAHNARPVDGNPYLWARNLLANRLYDCPVVYLEPYVMNSTIDYPRFQAGDYDGLREIGGRMQPSIFREYANSVAQGLRDYYTRSRRIEPAMENPLQR
jgi:N-acetylmuramoyl-L-alanine amidase